MDGSACIIASKASLTNPKSHAALSRTVPSYVLKINVFNNQPACAKSQVCPGVDGKTIEHDTSTLNKKKQSRQMYKVIGILSYCDSLGFLFDNECRNVELRFSFFFQKYTPKNILLVDR